MIRNKFKEKREEVRTAIKNGVTKAVQDDRQNMETKSTTSPLPTSTTKLARPSSHVASSYTYDKAQEDFNKGAMAGFKKGAAEGFRQGAAEGFKEGAADGLKQGAVQGFKDNGVKGAIKGGAQGALQGGTQAAIQGGVTGALKGGAHGAMQGGIENVAYNYSKSVLVDLSISTTKSAPLSNVGSSYNKPQDQDYNFITSPAALCPPPNLHDLKLTQDKLSYLNKMHGQVSGWTLGITLVQSKNKEEINEYINILGALNKTPEEKSKLILKEHFVNHILDMDPAVIFNLVKNFKIPTKFIKEKKLKETIIKHVENAYTEAEQLKIWKGRHQNELGSLLETHQSMFGRGNPRSVDIVEAKILHLTAVLARSCVLEQQASTLQEPATLFTSIIEQPVLPQSDHQMVYPALAAPTTQTPTAAPPRHVHFFQPERVSEPVHQDVIANKTESFSSFHLAVSAGLFLLLAYVVYSVNHETTASQQPSF